MAASDLDGHPKKASKVVIIGAILLILMGIPLLLGGGYIFYKNQETDENGFFLSNVCNVSTSAYAYAMGPQGWETSSSGDDGWMGREYRWFVKNNNPEKQIFLGIIEANRGYLYLMDFQSCVAQEWTYRATLYDVEITVPGTEWVNSVLDPPTNAPDRETFWLDTDLVGDSLSVTWNPEMSRYYLVLMNVDGSNGIDADVQLGYKIGLLSWVHYVVICLGLVFCVVGVFVFRRR